MAFNNSKANFKELGKDLAGVGTSLISTVVDVVKIPVALCKDFRDIYLESKKDKKVKKVLDTEAATA